MPPRDSDSIIADSFACQTTTHAAVGLRRRSTACSESATVARAGACGSWCHVGIRKEDTLWNNQPRRIRHLARLNGWPIKSPLDTLF